MTLADLAAWVKENGTTLRVEHFNGEFYVVSTWKHITVSRSDPELETVLARIVKDIDRWIVNEREYAQRRLEQP